MENAEKALKSSKEDTSIVAKELGVIHSEYLLYKERYDRLKRAFDRDTWLVPTTIIATSAIPSILLMANGNESGFYTLLGGLGASVIYEGGHLIFRLW